MTKNVNYVAVLADAVGSRALAPAARTRLQARLHTRLKELNKHRAWRPAIAAGFAISRGDEIEGLLVSAAPVWEIAHWLRGALPEVDWTIACARGPISTALAPTAPEVDGPCFHAARAALDAAKERRQVFTFRGFPAALDALADYYSALYWSWTPRQRRQAAALRLDDAAAPRLEPVNVHPTAISHLKRRMAWPLVVEGDRMLRAAIATTEGR
jgi:SatD family (SatD)